MPVKEEDMIAKTVDYLVTESTLNPAATLAEIQEFIKKLKTTGTTSVTSNVGGIRSVVCIEKTRMTVAQSEEVRKLMGMEDEEE